MTALENYLLEKSSNHWSALGLLPILSLQGGFFQRLILELNQRKKEQTSKLLYQISSRYLEAAKSVIL